jgi:alkylation response protein AidB-like acyl-CoA dehydrogenase
VTVTTTLPAPPATDLIDRARALAPLLRAEAAAGEADRRLTDTAIAALTEAGLFRMGTPQRYGGDGADMETMVRVAAALGEADGGASWIVALMTGCGWLASLFPEQARAEVFGAGPDTRVSGIISPTATAETVPGGRRVTGRWFFNSGSWWADWAVLAIPATRDIELVLVPASELSVEDTWFVAGMRSTASNCLVAEDVFVPEHRIISVHEATDGHYGTADEPVTRSAFVPVLNVLLVGPQLGLGRAALDTIMAKADKKITYTNFGVQRESVGFQLQVAEAALLLETAELHTYRACADVDELARRGEYPDMLTRARIKAQTGYAVQQVTKAIDILMYAGGAGGFAEVSVLQRIWRDSATAARHAVLAPQVGYEVYGRTLLGVSNTVTPMI